MSNFSFDSVETTLRNLKDIVDRNHSGSTETGQLVADMERLLGDIKAKTKERDIFSKIAEAAPIAIVNQTALSL